MFNILNLESKQLVEDESGTLSFETGPEAAAHAKSLTDSLGIKHQPRKAGNCADWKAREQARIDSGEYQVPQCLKSYLVPDHFAHVSKDKPEMLSYTKDDSKGRADLQTRITVRAYLTTFCGMDEGCEAVSCLCAEYASEVMPQELYFATTPAEIESVYTNYDESCEQVAGSCMRGDSWESGIHPVRIYGAGDLAIAYLANAEGETTDRALVWPEKLVYSRVYGESDKLHNLLKGLGYWKSAYYRTHYDRGEFPTFEGAKLLRLSASAYDDDCFVMPYIDEALGARLSGKYFILTKNCSDYDTHSTEGRTSDPDDDRGYCDNCEESCDSDSMSQVYTRSDAMRSQSWCESCTDNHSIRCEGTGDYYSDSCSMYELESGQTWSQSYFNDHGGTCEHTDTHHRNRDLSTVIVNNKGDEELWCDDAIESDAWECERTGKYYANEIDAIVVKVHGVEKRWSMEATELYGDECDVPPITDIPANPTLADRARLCTLRGTTDEQIELRLYGFDEADGLGDILERAMRRAA